MAYLTFLKAEYFFIIFIFLTFQDIYKRKADRLLTVALVSTQRERGRETTSTANPQLDTLIIQSRVLVFQVPLFIALRKA